MKRACPKTTHVIESARIPSKVRMDPFFGFAGLFYLQIDDTEKEVLSALGSVKLDDYYT